MTAAATRADRLLTAGVLALGLALAVALARDYGESWDEKDTQVHARDTLDAYLTLSAPADYFKNTVYYGPAYVAFAEVVARTVQRAAPDWLLLEGRHLAYFLAFPLAGLALQRLCARWVGRGAAWAAALLFLTQPLLFGHAFINPKDAPFMALFLVSLAAGAAWVDRLEPQGFWLADAQQARAPWRSLPAAAARVWRESPPGRRALFLAALALGAIAALDLLILHRLLLTALQQAVWRAYAGQAWAPINALFERLASRAGELPPNAYVAKLTALYAMLRGWAAILALVPAAALAAWLMAPLTGRLRPRRDWGRVVGAGALLGLTTSIRVLGPFAGALVALLALARAGRRALLPLALYGAAAALVCWATWPALWGRPLQGFLDSLETMTRFPWEHRVLYQGVVHAAADLPWHYAPFFVGTQLSEPAVLLGAAGLAIAVYELIARRGVRLERLAALLWLAAPLIGAMFLGMRVYDNGRQLLFAFPAVFLLAALALQALFDRLRAPALRLALALLVAAPGMAGIVRLHPYEYIYFNAAVGGVAGAARRYELDYWATSYRAAMHELNRLAPPNAWVAVADPWQSAWPFARPDLHHYRAGEAAAGRMPDLALVTTRSNRDQTYYPEARVVAEIRAGGAPLAVIKQVAP